MSRRPPETGSGPPAGAAGQSQRAAQSQGLRRRQRVDSLVEQPSNWCSPANASSVSESTPTTRSTCMVSARWAAKESKAVFPMPASPVRTRTPLRCRKADTSRCSIVTLAARP